MPLIYIVEDDINIREIQRYALKNSGFQVQEFEGGKGVVALPPLLFLFVCVGIITS